MKLSIGMIVKNEEHHLKNCLDAIQSLRDNIPCELIIADTGSTDRTKEIAADYADILFDFPWCNDFSAARNSTLERATGDWFLFLDADEYFVSTKEIEQFFLSGEYKEYHSATILVKSYLTAQHTEHLDFHCARFFDLSMPDARFINTIHEAIPAHKPTKMFLDMVEHYGYVHGGELEKKKSERNLALLYKELDKDPDNIRILAHLCREFPPNDENADKILQYANHGINVLRKLYQRLMSQGMLPKTARLVDANGEFYSLFHQKIVVLFNQKKWDEVITTCEQYFKGRSNPCRTDLDSYWFSGKSYFYQAKYSQAIEMYEKYLETYDLCEKGQMETEDTMYTYVHCLNESDKYQSYMDLASSYMKIEDYDKCFEYLSLLPVSHLGQFQIAFLGMEVSKRYEYLLTLWDKQSELCDPKAEENFLYTIENYIVQNRNKRKKIIPVLAKYEQFDAHHYVLLNRMRLAYDENLFDTVDNLLTELLSIKPFPRLLDDTIYYAMCRHMDISVLFDAVVIDDLKVYIADIKAGHSDFAEVVKKYFMENRYINSDYGMYWELMFEEAALLTNELNEKDALELLPNYLESVTKYTNLIYDKQMLNEDRLGVLPNYARFAYYVGQALEADNIGDELGYYRNMTKAVDQYKVMAKPIKLLTDHHQKEIEERQSKAKQDNQELMELAAQVKKQLYAFIEQENYPTAKEVLAGYEKIFPTDPDLTSIREMIVAGEAGNRSAIPS